MFLPADKEKVVSTRPIPSNWLRQIVRYAIHVLVLYLVVGFSNYWLADRFHDWIVPLLRGHQSTDSSLQFLMSHLVAFSFVPAFFSGLVNARFRHTVARFVWMVPVTLLVLNFFFRTPTVYPTMIFESDFKSAFHFWFGGDFHIGPYRTYSEFVDQFVLSRDFLRAYSQLRVTSPAYAGIAYSLAAWLVLKFGWFKPEPLSF